jgi:hypothetical protein
MITQVNIAVSGEIQINKVSESVQDLSQFLDYKVLETIKVVNLNKLGTFIANVLSIPKVCPAKPGEVIPEEELINLQSQIS